MTEAPSWRSLRGWFRGLTQEGVVPFHGLEPEMEDKEGKGKMSTGGSSSPAFSAVIRLEPQPMSQSKPFSLFLAMSKVINAWHLAMSWGFLPAGHRTHRLLSEDVELLLIQCLFLYCCPSPFSAALPEYQGVGPWETVAYFLTVLDSKTSKIKISAAGILTKQKEDKQKRGAGEGKREGECWPLPGLFIIPSTHFWGYNSCGLSASHKALFPALFQRGSTSQHIHFRAHIRAMVCCATVISIRVQNLACALKRLAILHGMFYASVYEAYEFQII